MDEPDPMQEYANALHRIEELNRELSDVHGEVERLRDALMRIVAECDASVSCPHCQQDYGHMDSCPIGKAKELLDE